MCVSVVSYLQEKLINEHVFGLDNLQKLNFRNSHKKFGFVKTTVILKLC